DSQKTARRLAEAYFNVGSYSLAMQECEALLLKQPNAPEILAMLGEIEARVQGTSNGTVETGASGGLIASAPASVPGNDGSLIDRTKFAFVPLEYYDIDRQIARMLPENLTLGRMFVPFDLISRTIMVACANPFDAAGREAVQQSLDYTVAWYLARPSAIIRTLPEVYRLG